MKVITKLINRCATFIRNDYCVMERLSSIYKSVGMKPPEEMINESSAKLIQKIVYHGKPEQIFNLIKKPRSRDTVEYSCKLKPKCERFKRTLIYDVIKQFNRIPSKLRPTKPSKLKQYLKKNGLEPERFQ